MRKKLQVNVYNQGQLRLYNQDCLQVFSTLDSESVDLIVTSPPYCMGKKYENVSDDVESFITMNRKAISKSQRVLRKGGSLCWQVGFHVKDSIVVPLDCLVYDIVEKINRSLADDSKLYLHNRIVWCFGHGLNAEKRLSGRYETIMWFTKGKEYNFNLNAIRIPQKYPGKKYAKGIKAGQFSGNVAGKNPSDVWQIPSDVWDIPNVKANHIEKTEHPCQFPIAIPQRLIKALTKPGDVVMDPFSGSGTTAVACVLENRKFIGCELKEEYIEIADKRINEALNGDIKYRPDVPVIEPDLSQKVAQKPEGFKW